MRRFAVGGQYEMRSPANWDCKWVFWVISRTAKTVTLQENNSRGRIVKCRINDYVSKASGCESVFPLGRYSMAPVLRA